VAVVSYTLWEYDLESDEDEEKSGMSRAIQDKNPAPKPSPHDIIETPAAGKKRVTPVKSVERDSPFYIENKGKGGERFFKQFGIRDIFTPMSVPNPSLIAIFHLRSAPFRINKQEQSRGHLEYLQANYPIRVTSTRTTYRSEPTNRKPTTKTPAKPMAQRPARVISEIR